MDSRPFYNRWDLVLLLSFTLGLAPFVPEPHIVGKLRWIAGGAVGMKPMDYFDLIFHGIPWLLLGRLIILKTFQIFRQKSAAK